MDRRIASSSNFDFLNQDSRGYILGANRSQLNQYDSELLKKDWQRVQPGLFGSKASGEP